MSLDTIVTDDGPTIVLTVAEQGPEGPPGGIVEVRFPVALQASTSSTQVLPAGSFVWYAALAIETAYDGGAQVLVGNATTPAALMGSGDNVPSVPGTYELSLDVDWPADAPVLVSLAGAPTQGAAVCVIRYTTPVS